MAISDQPKNLALAIGQERLNRCVVSGNVCETRGNRRVTRDDDHVGCRRNIRDRRTDTDNLEGRARAERSRQRRADLLRLGDDRDAGHNRCIVTPRESRVPDR